MNTKATLYKVNENSKSGICIPKNEKNEIKLGRILSIGESSDYFK